jgi:hypothetical protein
VAISAALPLADVLHRVRRLGRDEQDVACVEWCGRTAVDPVLERPLGDVDDLLARMLVPDGRCVRADVGAALNDLASGNAEIDVATAPLPAAAGSVKTLLRRGSS